MASSQHIYRALRQEILSLALEPGQKLREEDLAARFSVSRTPVRAAISRLEAERLIRVEPRKGTFVSEIDLDYVRQLIFLRTSVELRMLPLLCREQPAALWEAMEENLARQKRLLEEGPEPSRFYRLDNRFHELYFSHLGMDAVWKLLQQFHVHYTRFRVLDMRQSGLFSQFYEEHRRQLDLLRAGGEEALSRLIVRHLESPLERVNRQNLQKESAASSSFVQNFS